MKDVETEGSTIDEAIENALKILGVGRDKVTVDIVAEGSRGILGFGAQKARIRASLRKPVLEMQQRPEREISEDKQTEDERAALGEQGREVLAQILGLMGVRGAIEVKKGEGEKGIVLDIRADSGGLLIGRRGETLGALQYLVIRILSKTRDTEELELIVDTENYRERRRKELEDMALRLGEKAKRQRKTVTLDPLSAADRRIVHLALQDDPWLTTRSLGRGPYRRLLIIPEGDRKRKEEDKGLAAAKQAPKQQR